MDRIISRADVASHIADTIEKSQKVTVVLGGNGAFLNKIFGMLQKRVEDANHHTYFVVEAQREYTETAEKIAALVQDSGFDNIGIAKTMNRLTWTGLITPEQVLFVKGQRLHISEAGDKVYQSYLDDMARITGVANQQAQRRLSTQPRPSRLTY